MFSQRWQFDHLILCLRTYEMEYPIMLKMQNWCTTRIGRWKDRDSSGLASEGDHGNGFLDLRDRVWSGQVTADPTVGAHAVAEQARNSMRQVIGPPAAAR
jgi:hypothetical protein